MAIIADGRLFEATTYMFINKADGNRALNVWCSSSYPATNQSNVCLWTKDTNDTAQHWVIDRIDMTHYVLRSSANSQKCLDLYTGSGTGANSNAQLYTPSETSYLTFEVGNYSDTVRIKLAGNTNNGYYLTANPGDNGKRTEKSSTDVGNVFFKSTRVYDDSQEWIVHRVGTTSGGEEDETEGQKLVLPINYCKLNASYKNAAYEVTYKGDIHYGIDIVYDKNADPNFDPITGVRDRTIRASGNGEVIANGWDTNLGYVIVIKYPNAYHKTTGTYKDVIIRYCHLNSIDSSIVEGASVNASTVIGVYGGSGYGKMDKWSPHLHIETDEDTEYPCYSPTFAPDGEIIYGRNSGANDSTMSNPLTWLYVGNGMTYTTAGDAYINSGDETLETI